MDNTMYDAENDEELHDMMDSGWLRVTNQHPEQSTYAAAMIALANATMAMQHFYEVHDIKQVEQAPLQSAGYAHVYAAHATCVTVHTLLTVLTTQQMQIEELQAKVADLQAKTVKPH